MQMYIVDTEHELQNRMDNMQGLNAEKLAALEEMMHQHNPYYRAFKTAGERVSHNARLRMRITSGRLASIQPRIQPTASEIMHAGPGFGARDRHRGTMNMPQAGEVAALVPEQSAEERCAAREIIVCGRGGHLKRISEMDPSYDPLHYVLLFPYGELGWHPALKDPQGRKSLASSILHIGKKIPNHPGTRDSLRHRDAISHN